jgi:hypothetical protein
MTHSGTGVQQFIQPPAEFLRHFRPDRHNPLVVTGKLPALDRILLGHEDRAAIAETDIFTLETVMVRECMGFDQHTVLLQRLEKPGRVPDTRNGMHRLPAELSQGTLLLPITEQLRIPDQHTHGVFTFTGKSVDHNKVNFLQAPQRFT